MLACLPVWAPHIMSTTSTTSMGLYPLPSTGCLSSQEGATVSPHPTSHPHHLSIIWAVLLGLRSYWWDHVSHWYLKPWLASWCYTALHAPCTHPLILASIPLFIDHIGRGLRLSFCIVQLYKRDGYEKEDASHMLFTISKTHNVKIAIFISAFTFYINKWSQSERDELTALQIQLCHLLHVRHASAFMVYEWYGLYGQTFFFFS